MLPLISRLRPACRVRAPPLLPVTTRALFRVMSLLACRTNEDPVANWAARAEGCRVTVWPIARL